MRKLGLTIFAISLFFSTASAFIYLTQTTPGDICVATAQTADKVGTATETTYLGLFTTGDASIIKAMESAKITKIHHVEYACKNYYIVLSEFKTIVYGQ